jgi:hypothetical protein
VICLDRIRMNSIRSGLPHAVRVLCNIPRVSTLCDARCIHKILPEKLTESPVVGRLHDERGDIMHTQIPSEDSSKPPSAHQPSPNPILRFCIRATENIATCNDISDLHLLISSYTLDLVCLQSPQPLYITYHQSCTSPTTRNGCRCYP